jgi:hypothetical protein
MHEKSFFIDFGDNPKVSDVIRELQKLRDQVGDVPVTNTYDGYASQVKFFYNNWANELSLFMS